MIDLARTAAAGALVVLPGAWITFGLPLATLPFWARLLGAVAITPLLLCVEFYALRLIGLSFETTAVVLAVANLPALVPFVKQLRTCRIPTLRLALGAAAMLIVPLACLVPQALDTQARAYSGHAWMHADVVYMIANGDLLLDDPELVGVRLAYYWGGHVYHAVLSYLLGSPPVSNYLSINVVFLLVTFAFMAGIVAELGGGLRARLASIVLLCFGVNFVGYVGGMLLRSLPYGDTRYTPWMLYFQFPIPMNQAMGMFAALTYLLIKGGPSPFTTTLLVPVFLLLCSIGIVYPILFPVAAALVGARAIGSWIERATGAPRVTPDVRGMLMLALVLVAGTAITAAYLMMLTRDRVTASILIAPIGVTAHKSARNLIVMLPLLAGFAYALRRSWGAKRGAVLVLAVGAVASLIAATAISIPPDDDEYKFISTAALCMAPFAAMALEPLLDRFGRLAVPALGALALILAAPFAHKLYQHWPWGYAQSAIVYSPRPRVDAHQFDLRLAEGEELSDLLDAIRQRTPPNSLLVADSEELQLTTLTRRRLYAPSAQRKQRPGMNVFSDHLLTKVRGYDARVLNERRATLQTLFEFKDPMNGAAALGRILDFERPVALVLDERRHTGLLTWLDEIGRASTVYRGDRYSVRLFEANGDSGS
jgi:hypothetical protein